MSGQYVTFILFMLLVLVSGYGIGKTTRLFTGMKILKDVEMLRTDEQFERYRRYALEAGVSVVLVTLIAVFMFLFIQAGYL